MFECLEWRSKPQEGSLWPPLEKRYKIHKEIQTHREKRKKKDKVIIRNKN